MLEKSPKIALKKVSYYALNFIILAVFYFIGTIPNTAHSTPFNFSTLFLKTHFPSSICLNSNSKPPKAPSYRGISVGQDQSLWISGSNGMVLKLKKSDRVPPYHAMDKMDSHAALATHQLKITEMHCTWDTVSPRGFGSLDFRDIESKDAGTAIVMSVGDSSQLLKTVDSGKTWTPVYRNFSKHVFLDAIAMDWKSGIGLAIGDPQTYDELIRGDSFNGFGSLNNQQHVYVPKIQSEAISSPGLSQLKYYLILITMDYGSTWQRIESCSALIPQDSIAAFFAGSGTSLLIEKCKFKRNNNNQLESFYIQVGMAGGGINPVYRSMQICGRSNSVKSIKPDHQKTAEISSSPPAKSIQRSSMAATTTANYNSATPTLTLTLNYSDLPLSLGHGAGWGAYGGTIADHHIVWVGGNYQFPNRGDSTVNIFPRHKKSRSRANSIYQQTARPEIHRTSGYKSGVCVCQNDINHWYTAGSSGLDVSMDFGKTWALLYVPTVLTIPSENKPIYVPNAQSGGSIESGNSTSQNPPLLNAVACYGDGIVVTGNKGLIKYFSISPLGR